MKAGGAFLWHRRDRLGILHSSVVGKVASDTAKRIPDMAGQITEKRRSESYYLGTWLIRRRRFLACERATLVMELSPSGKRTFVLKVNDSLAFQAPKEHGW